MMRDLLVRERVSERLLAFPDGERRLTNLGHLVELLQAASMRRGGGADPLVEWLADARGGVREAEVTPDQHLLRLESDAGLVQIVTVHKAKGLQYPIVFCPFLWEGRLRAGRSEDVVFHAPDAEGATLDLGTTGGAGHRRLACAEELAERLRLLYVALTRAEHRCYLVWGKVKDGGGAPLAWLFHAGDEQAPLEAVAERYGRLDAAALLAEVQEVARRAGGAIAVERIPEEGRVRVMPSAPTAEQLAPRTLRHPVRAPWAIASFSALVAADEELERRDFDQMDEQPGEAVSRLDVHGFPRGARAGRCLHAILEAVDFLSPERAVVDRTLAAFGIAPEWGPVVAEWLDRILATPLDASGLRLGTVPRSRRVDELEFHYPAREVEVVRLARALAEAGFAGGAFVDAAARLPPRTPAGFLKGFIDCVFEHEGRFFVLDYKSNRLGDGPDAYTAAALVPAMARGQYWLQYLVYVVAVHRWLGRRLVGYDYDRHFGGVRYLFLRGMDPVRGWGGGVYADRPSRGVIELLDAALAGQGG
jgi:exodeoxyribonuclease V beta subunit